MLGVDLVDIGRFKKKIIDKGLENDLFSREEISYARASKSYSESLAGIFAAKEAIIKAGRLSLTDLLRGRIEISHQEGRPLGRVNGKKIEGDLSISHEGGFALAACQIKNMPNERPVFDMTLPKRKPDSHKGDYGKIGILGGSFGMTGSIFMAGRSALRSGAGLVYLLCPESISKILQIKCQEEIVRPLPCQKLTYNENLASALEEEIKKLDCLAIGPGMGQDPFGNDLVNFLLRKFDGKVLIDADGLNAVSKNPEILGGRGDLVLTPHEMEFARLIGKPLSEVKENRQVLSMNFAKRYGLVLVLKGNETIVTNGEDFYINKTGNPGMATAGSGDCLSGMIASLLYRFSPFEAAKLGVYLHGLAGDLAEKDIGEESLIATDIIRYLPAAFKLLKNE